MTLVCPTLGEVRALAPSTAHNYQSLNDGSRSRAVKVFSSDSGPRRPSLAAMRRPVATPAPRTMSWAR
jgi:hypothetical protein